MNSLDQHFQAYQEAGALHALVALDTAVDEHILATKSGDLAVALKLKGIDPGCMEPEAINEIVRRYETALKGFDDRFRLQHYLFKSEHPGLSADPCANPVVNEAVQNRLGYLNAKSERLYTMENVLFVVYEGWRGALGATRQRFLGFNAALRPAFSAEKARSALNEDLDLARELLMAKVHNFVAQIQDFLDATVLDKQAAFAIQRRLLNYSAIKCDGVGLVGDHFLDYQACGSHLECHRDFLQLDDAYISVLTLKEAPPQTHAMMLASLVGLRSPFIVTSDWRRWASGKIRREIQSRRRHFHNSQSALSTQLSASGSRPADGLIDNAAVAMVGNLGACLEEIDFKGRHFGEYSLSIVLYEQDAKVLRRSVAECLKIFAAHDAQLTDERYNRLNAWLAVQPGNAAFNLRRMWITDTNYADLSLLFSPATGDLRNAHLGREYLAVFEGQDQSPYYFNFHYADVGHVFICGQTGSGKSFTLNFLITHLGKYDPIVRIFDLGGSYESLTRLSGGSYLSVRSADGQAQKTTELPFTINPFCLPPTQENLLFLLAWVKVLIGSPLTAEEEKDLYEQIENLYYVSPEQRRLSTLVNIVHRNLRGPLQRWTRGGPYGPFFDNAEDTLTMSSFQTFDFEGMMEAKEALEPLLFYVLHRANAVIDEEPGRLKVFLMDEAWRFFGNPVIKAYMVEALKTWRKKNACLILATQSVDDLTSSAILPVVMESCPTQLFLANPRMNRESYRQAFHLNERELDLIATLVPKKELLVKRPDHSKVVRLDVGRKEYWIYTNNASDTVRKRDAFARYGFEAGLEHLTKENS